MDLSFAFFTNFDAISNLSSSFFPPPLCIIYSVANGPVCPENGPLMGYIGVRHFAETFIMAVHDVCTHHCLPKKKSYLNIDQSQHCGYLGPVSASLPTMSRNCWKEISPGKPSNSFGCVCKSERALWLYLWRCRARGSRWIYVTDQFCDDFSGIVIGHLMAKRGRQCWVHKLLGFTFWPAHKHGYACLCTYADSIPLAAQPLTCSLKHARATLTSSPCSLSKAPNSSASIVPLPFASIISKDALSVEFVSCFSVHAVVHVRVRTSCVDIVLRECVDHLGK